MIDNICSIFSEIFTSIPIENIGKTLLFPRFKGVLTLREKCPDTEFYLVRIFHYSDWINLVRKSPYLVHIRENMDLKKLRIWTLFTLKNGSLSSNGLIGPVFDIDVWQKCFLQNSDDFMVVKYLADSKILFQFDLEPFNRSNIQRSSHNKTFLNLRKVL